MRSIQGIIVDRLSASFDVLTEKAAIDAASNGRHIDVHMIVLFSPLTSEDGCCKDDQYAYQSRQYSTVENLPLRNFLLAYFLKKAS